MAERVKQNNKGRPTRKQDNGRGLPTVPDLVILSLLAERPMHGYQVNATLEQRNIREWAPVSRPQIYYSLDKLVKLGLIRVAKDENPAAGPERTVFETTAQGRDRLADALESRHWIEDRAYQPFVIWLALSWQTRGRTFRNQLKGRHQFLSERLVSERATLKAVRKEVGHDHHEAVWILELKIDQTRLEIRWIEGILANADKRAAADHPVFPE
jgi:DNA-binding PadR family transcriptional regulator